MQPFVINSHGRMVFPSNFLPELDFSVIDDLDQLEAVIRRDFEAKAPQRHRDPARIEAGDHYSTRYELMRDVALNLFWTNRFAMTMYDKRPTRWRDVPRNRDDVFLPVCRPWKDAERKVAAIQELFAALPATWNGEVEDRIFQVLFDVLRHRSSTPPSCRPSSPRSPRSSPEPESLTYSLDVYDPDYPVYGYQQILDCTEEVAELEALHRWAMVLHNQYPWDRTQTRLTPVGELRDDDYVIVFHPRSRDVDDFIRRATRGGTCQRSSQPGHRERRRGEATGPSLPAGARAGAVLRAAEARGARRGQGRAPLHQRRHHPQHRVQLVADVGRRRSPRRPVSSRGSYSARPLEDLALQAARAGARARGPRPGGDRRRAVLLVHQHPDDAVGGHLAVGAAGHAADPRVVRHRRGVRRPPLRARGGDPAAAGGRTAPSCWSAARSSPTRSARSARRA